MADNITATPGTGLTLATDDIGGVHYPRTKLSIGDDGSAADVSATNPMPVSAAALTTLAAAVKPEDSPSANGDVGLVILAQRRDTDASAADADGDYVTLKMDEAGRLKVATQPASYALVTGTITANGQTAFCDVRRVSNVMIHMTTAALAGHNVTFEGSIDSTNGTDGAWFAIQVVRSNANTIELTSGALAATPAYGWEASVNGLAFVRVRATAHTSGTATWKFLAGTYATEPIPAAQATATQPVSGTVTANIGTGSLAAGTNAIGDVGLQFRANATGAATIAHIVSAASTNAASVKASAGRVVGWQFTNTTASWQYVKLHNLAGTPTAGVAVAMTIAIPPNGTNVMPVGGAGIGFATGIGRTIVTGSADADATATTAGAVVGDLFYA